MAQPFGVGDVVGGRYRVTHHVVTSADQDIIFQAVDQVLDREVSVLLASRANAKQVATSAKELATGERSSSVQVLDLGLAAERTYLISSVVDPNELLDLVVPDAAPYVEPYFTDSLGSELFGQSREMQPQTYDDDAEYYARLQADLAESAEQNRRIPGLPRRRPAFLDKVTAQHAESDEPDETRDQPDDSDSEQNLRSELAAAGEAHGIRPSQQIRRVFSLSSDMELVEADPAADVADEDLEALYAWAPKSGSSVPEGKDTAPPSQGLSSSAENSQSSGPSTTDDDDNSAAMYEAAPSAPISTVPVSSHASPTRRPVTVESAVAEGEEVVDDPPQQPDPAFDPTRAERRTSRPSEAEGNAPSTHHQADDPESAAGRQAASFTNLISAVPSKEPTSFPAPEDPSREEPQLVSSSDQGTPPVMWWIAVAVLAALVLAAAVIVFLSLNGS